MPNRINYQLEMEKVLRTLDGTRPKLLLHACCAPCSSATLERLSAHFDLTILYYNPNIYPPEEYHRREAELERFVEQAGYHYPVVELPYDPQEFYTADHGFDWYCTTLSISPMKDPVRLNELGTELGRQYGVPFLPSEFRKKDGYKRSLQLSAEYGLYRQDYCGCIFSKQERGV